MTEANSSQEPASLPPELPPVIRQREPGWEYDGVIGWREFFNLTGGSIVYCLSALSVIYGIANILSPVLAKSDFLREALPCIATLNVYEIALLAVLVVIVVWRNVTDDAVSLLIIAPLLLVANGILLTSLADTAPQVALGIGLFCAVLGASKVHALRRWVRLDWSRAGIGAVVFVFVWNFLVNGLLSRTPGTVVAGSRERWLWGWVVLLAAGAVLVWDAVQRGQRPAPTTTQATPFLQRAPMTWIFAAVLLAAAGVHQYALSYIFDVRYGFGDYLPLVSVVTLLLLQLSLTQSRQPNSFQSGLALLPLLVCAMAVLSGTVLARPQLGVELLWYPPVLLLFTGAGVAWMAIRNRAPVLWPACGAYLVGAVLTTGFHPSLELSHLNWEMTGILLAVAFLIAGWWYERPELCFPSVVIVAVGAAVKAQGGQWLDPGGMFAAVLGLGTIGLAVWFGKKLPVVLLVIGALALLVAAFDFLPEELSGRDWLAIGILALCAVGLWWRCRVWAVMGLFGVPVVYRLWLVFLHLTAWRFVVLGFLLLFGGAWLSLRKGRKRQPADASGNQP